MVEGGAKKGRRRGELFAFVDVQFEEGGEVLGGTEDRGLGIVG